MPDKNPKPVGEEEVPLGNEEPRRAPGSEQEYQGGATTEKRAPGVEEDNRVDEEGGEKRKSA
jgi:hypothetical protein